MLFVQHLAERGLRSHLQLSGITAMLNESRCSGNITGARSSGRPVAPCILRSLRLPGSVGEAIPSYKHSPLQEGRRRRWEGWAPLRRLGRGGSGLQGSTTHGRWLWGGPAAAQTSPSWSGLEVPLTLNKISVQEAVSWYMATGVLACLVNVLV